MAAAFLHSLRLNVAELLNAPNAEVNYPLTENEIITLIRSAFANGTTAAAHALLGGYNKTFDCPLARADL